MSAPRVLFAPAYSPRSGGGHLMRCLSLAATLGERARSTFLIPPDAVSLAERFATTPIEIVEHRANVQADAVVIDDYGVDAVGEQELRRQARVLLAIDDLADRRHEAEILVDPGFGRAATDYAGLVPDGATLLMGSDYALLRPIFPMLRSRVAEALPAVGTVFISFGLSDVGGVCAKAVGAIRPLLPDARLHIALGSWAESLQTLQQLAASDPSVTLYVDATDVAELMLAADIGVGAGGGSTWERCCMGLPSAAVVVADNQRPVIEALDAQGVLFGVDMTRSGWEDRLRTAVMRLVDADTRRRLRTASMTTCDGRGAERVADALLTRLT